MQSSSETTVLFATDFPIFRRSVAKLLEDTQKIHVVCAETADDVLPLADVHYPQIAVLDLDIDFVKLCELAGGLSLRSIPTLLMGDGLDETKIFELLQHGIGGVIPRSASQEMLCKSVRAVASGEIWISRSAVTDLVQRVRTTAAQTPSDNRFHLTPREMQIVEAIREGMTNNAISEHLAISKNTVKQHLTNIYDKCGVSSRLALAMVHQTNRQELAEPLLTPASMDFWQAS